MPTDSRTELAFRPSLRRVLVVHRWYVSSVLILLLGSIATALVIHLELISAAFAPVSAALGFIALIRSVVFPFRCFYSDVVESLISEIDDSIVLSVTCAADFRQYIRGDGNGGAPWIAFLVLTPGAMGVWQVRKGRVIERVRLERHDVVSFRHEYPPHVYIMGGTYEGISMDARSGNSVVQLSFVPQPTGRITNLMAPMRMVKILRAWKDGQKII